MSKRPDSTTKAWSRREERALPASWGRDELTKFLGAAESNCIAFFAGNEEWVKALRLIDRTLIERAPDYFHEASVDQQPSARLFMRAYGTYRGAIRLACSGQLFEATVLARSVVESSVYAWACAISEDHRAAWLNRSNDAASRKRSRRVFLWSELMKVLRSRHPRVADACETLYDGLIDDGAHPNVKGVMLSASAEPLSDGKVALSTTFLHGQEAAMVALLDLFRAIGVTMRLLEDSFGFRLTILGVDREIAMAREQLDRLLASLRKQVDAMRQVTPLSESSL